MDFDCRHLRGAPAEVESLVHNIKEVAQQFLYHWKTFPIVLPISLSSQNNQANNGEDSLARKKHQYHLRDMFVAPSFDELDAVAVDTKGEPRRLTNKQLESIRERGCVVNCFFLSFFRARFITLFSGVFFSTLSCLTL